ncbi:MAG: PIN domain-containing protein [Actinomycetota bacterium]|nr:PIN domain-containing protein [Actinomycetota bacterium]
MSFALDSWAVLRFLEGVDPAATRVGQVLDAGRPVMSWINLGEVFYVVCRQHGEGEAIEVIHDLRPRLALDLPSESRVLQAARLKSGHAIAYADAFAASTAIAHDAILLTGDPELLAEDVPWRSEGLVG